MKKILTTALLLTTLASCGTKTVIVEKVSDTVAPVTTLAHKNDTNELETTYLNNLVSDFPSEVAVLGKTKTIQLGYLACQAIDEGATITDFAIVAVKNNVDARFIGALIRESIHNFCPENQWFIDSVVNA